ncbi:hypothetical protein ADIS_4803 [Lunatimonas lonarensis]|uniref:Uncharacterized protein n=1 Tax=Lunatimonas lonarensis TaxID=1232681 RepID=R7ZKT8_9BACT|nr:hypothetical protein ADIS_4803 [Lunatimonas lonarensis]
MLKSFFLAFWVRQQIQSYKPGTLIRKAEKQGKTKSNSGFER